MEVRSGRALQPGVALGPVYVQLPRRTGEEPSAFQGEREELARFEGARQRTLLQLDHLYRRTREQVGEEQAEVFHLHRLMLEDGDYLDQVRQAVQGGEPAPGAVLAAGETFAAALEELADPYLRARAADVREVSRAVWEQLQGERAPLELDRPAILVAGDIAPAQLIELGREKLLGLVLRDTAPQSHAAILARAMAIPAVTGVGGDPAWQGREGALDGARGLFWLEPDGETRAALREEERRAGEEATRLAGLAALPSRTRDGREVAVCANIGSPQEAEEAVRLGAQGVGLFRTEFLFLGTEHPPTEEEQYALYRRAVEAMGGRRLVIRTLDLGADKCPAWLPLPREENPALGCRGIRVSRANPKLFATQLRAILRAAAGGRVAVMFPMVTSAEEVRWAREQIEACRAALRREGTAFGPLEVGVMIETPAAALLARELAREVDFFSLGTNDLTQYTLAMDRQTGETAGGWDPLHPAVLELIGHTAEEGHRLGRRVALCGQLGADLTATETLLRLGVDELSVPPAAVLPLREKIRGLDLSGPAE